MSAEAIVIGIWALLTVAFFGSFLVLVIRTIQHNAQMRREGRHDLTLGPF